MNTTNKAPTGEQFTINFKNQTVRYEATIVSLAAGLRSLTLNDHDLVESYPISELPPMGSGIVLAPWPNRVAEASWDGPLNPASEPQQLDVTERSSGNAIHGLLRNTGYSCTQQTESVVELSAAIYPQHGYPFHIETSVRYELSEHGLEVTHRFENVGSQTAPIGLGAHPYLKVGKTPTEQLTLTVAADEYYAVNDSMIPTISIPVTGQYDLREGKCIADIDLDTGFSHLNHHNTRQRYGHLLSAPQGDSTMLWADLKLPYVQIFTPRNFAGHLAVAIEPMSCPANALNSQEGLIALKASEKWVAQWGITGKIKG